MQRSNERDLTGGGGENKYSIHVGLHIGGENKKSRPAGLIALRRSDQFLPVLEDHFDLFPHNRFGCIKCFFLLVLLVSDKVLHKKHSLQCVDENIKRLGTGRGIQRDEMKNVLVGHEIVRITLYHTTILIMHNDLILHYKIPSRITQSCTVQSEKSIIEFMKK